MPEEIIVPMDVYESVVHHSIIDMYEIDDEPEVTRAHICNYTGLLLRDVSSAMDSLISKGIIKMGEGGVVLEAKNNGYFPIEE